MFVGYVSVSRNFTSKRVRKLKENSQKGSSPRPLSQVTLTRADALGSLSRAEQGWPPPQGFLFSLGASWLQALLPRTPRPALASRLSYKAAPTLVSSRPGPTRGGAGRGNLRAGHLPLWLALSSAFLSWGRRDFPEPGRPWGRGPRGTGHSWGGGGGQR